MPVRQLLYRARYAGPMSAWRPSKCKVCGASRTANRAISKQGYCPKCGLAAQREAIQNMRDKTGPYHDRYIAANGHRGRRRAPKSGQLKDDGGSG